MGANHGYGALVSNLGRNNRLRRLGGRRDDRCRLAFGLDAHGFTCRHSRIAQLYEAFRDARTSLVIHSHSTLGPLTPARRSDTHHLPSPAGDNRRYQIQYFYNDLADARVRRVAIGFQRFLDDLTDE